MCHLEGEFKVHCFLIQEEFNILSSVTRTEFGSSSCSSSHARATVALCSIRRPQQPSTTCSQGQTPARSGYNVERWCGQEAISSKSPYPQQCMPGASLGTLAPKFLIHPSGKHTFLHARMYFKIMYTSNIDVAHFKHLK